MALMICSECGKEYSDKAVACPNCGCPTPHTGSHPQGGATYVTAAGNHSQFADENADKLARKLSTKEQTSGIIWIAIAIVQVIIGFLGMPWVWIMAVINLIGAVKSFKKSKLVLEPYNGMVEEYEKQLIPLIVALAFNLLVGAFVGVAGNIYDMFTRNFVLDNKDIFDHAAGKSAVQKSIIKPAVERSTKKMDPAAYAAAAKNPANWVCDCGRINPNYVSSCVCGVSKHKR